MEGDGEAVGLVPDPHEETEHGVALRQDERRLPSGQQQALGALVLAARLRQGDDGHVEPGVGERAARGVELRAPAVDQEEVGRLAELRATREAPRDDLGHPRDVVAPGRVEQQGAGELVESVFAEGAGRVRMKVIEHDDPEEAALAESRDDYDLVVVGVGRTWGLGNRPLGVGVAPEPLIEGCPTSLLVVRGPSPTAAPLALARLARLQQMAAS